MSIDPERRPRRLRILSGTVEELELQLNTVLDEYMALVWNFQVVGERIHGTVVMVHASEIRKQQLAQGAVMGGRH